MHIHSCHVIPGAKGGWDVRRDDRQRASRHFDTKTEAISYGRQLSRKEHSDFYVHEQDGEIQKKDDQVTDE